MSRHLWFAAALLLGTLLSSGLPRKAAAETPETAPSALTEALTQIEAAANGQDLQAVMALYHADFSHGDGFDRDRYQETLSQLWSAYDSLEYDVELLSWESQGSALIAETLTTIQGTQMAFGREFALTAEIRSRQRFENGQIVSQEILSEHSQRVAGVNPPTLTVQLPEQVAPGAEFTFDAIVQEPLGDRVLLGRALDEGVTAEDFLAPRPIDLELLPAGGLFKLGKAPDKADQRWISAVIVREDGIVIDTRRLQVRN